MDTKLTLKLDKDIIEKGKKYAAKQKISLSWMVENYLRALVTKENKKENFEEIEISDFVKSITLENGGIPADFDYKKDRQDYLVEKYNSL